MPAPAQLRPLNLWPLGIVTVTTAGTPVAAIANISSGGGITKTFECRQVRIQNISDSSDVYVNYGNFAGIDANGTMAILAAGESVSFPDGGLSDTKIDLSKIYLDASANGGTAIVTAFSGS